MRNKQIEPKYNRLTLVEELEPIRYVKSTQRIFLCECECGNKKVVMLQHLKSGKIKSCGCYNVEVASKRFSDLNTEHNNYYHPLWSIYYNMKRRCYQTHRKDYPLYGGRGIKVEDVWLGDEGFNNFVKDMGLKPNKFYSIDRIDVNKNYGPDNCKWSTPKEQANNRRNKI